MRGFALAGVHRLDAGPDDLRSVRGFVESEGQQRCDGRGKEEFVSTWKKVTLVKGMPIFTYW